VEEGRELTCSYVIPAVLAMISVSFWVRIWVLEYAVSKIAIESYVVVKVRWAIGEPKDLLDKRQRCFWGESVHRSLRRGPYA